MTKETIDDVVIVSAVNISGFIISMLTHFEMTLRISVLILSGCYTLWKWYKDINKEKIEKK